MKELWQLFAVFAKIGVMTFGGGAAMLPMLQRELVEKRKWVEEEELMDYYAIGQCTPGIIAVNTATFVGQNRKGDIGGIFATAGMVFPSLVIILTWHGCRTPLPVFVPVCAYRFSMPFGSWPKRPSWISGRQVSSRQCWRQLR